MKIEQQPAYVLHTRPVTESSLLVDLFTPMHGRMTALAKGARRRKSPFRGVLLPFRALLTSCTGKGLPILATAEQHRPAAWRAANMSCEALASGFYMNELLQRLLHRHDAHETLFAHYHAAVCGLIEAHPPRRVLRIFEKKLLRDIGFGAALECDADSGEALRPELRYHYVWEKGPVRIRPAPSDDQTGDLAGAPADNPAPGGDKGESTAASPNESTAARMLTISGRALCALRDDNFADDDIESERELRDVQHLTRALLDRQLHGRALRTRRVARDMQRYRSRATDSAAREADLK